MTLQMLVGNDTNFALAAGLITPADVKMNSIESSYSLWKCFTVIALLLPHLGTVLFYPR